MIRHAIRMLLLSAAHWIVTLVCLVGEQMTARFLAIFEPGPSHPVWSAFLAAFEFPLLTVYRLVDPVRLSHYLPVMIANSLLWGYLLYTLIRFLRRRRSHFSGTSLVHFRTIQ